ncbi:MAG: hypothetical protein EXR77_06605 [Myxococcales bacterium]|nr:hypothetical protein [Myxococcales bacterium]
MNSDSSTVKTLEIVREWLAREPAAAVDHAEVIERIDLELDELLDASRRFAHAIAGRADCWQDAKVIDIQQQLADRRRELMARWIDAVVSLRLGGVRLKPEIRPTFRRGESRPAAVDGELRDRITGEYGAVARSPSGPFVAVDEFKRHRLQAQLSGQYAAVVAPPPVFSLPLAQSVRAELGEIPAALDTDEAVRTELKLLVRCTRPERQETWRSLPADVQVPVIAHLAARARCLQEPPALPILTLLDVDRQIENLFNALSRYTKEEAPGFVYGLARSHGSRSDSWLKDAQDHLTLLNELIAVRAEPTKPNPEREIAKLEALLAEDGGDDPIIEHLDAVIAAGVARTDPRLVRICRPKLELLGKHARFKPLRKAIKEGDEIEEAPDRQTGPAADWAHWSAVRGKRAALIGGDPREDARARIEHCFEFAGLSWEGIDQVRQVDALANQIRAGGVEFVIVLQSYINHAVCGKIVDACRGAKVPFASVERGYGVERIRLAIEQDLGKRPAEAS